MLFSPQDIEMDDNDEREPEEIDDIYVVLYFIIPFEFYSESQYL